MRKTLKRNIRLILTVMLIAVFTTTAYAERASAVGYTPTDVMDWYLTDQDNAADITEQAVNAASRVAENLVYVDSLNASEEQLQLLQDILDEITQMRNSEEESAEQKLGMSCVYIMKALIVLAQESDPTGVYDEQLEGIIDSYNEADETVDSAEHQTVNALFSSIKLAALVVEECCTSQEQIDQIEAGLSELDAENEAAADVYEQMVVGSRWLRKMLGAFAKLNNENCIDAVEQEMENREGIVSEMTDPMQITNEYLTSSMFVLGLFTGDYSLD